MASLPAREQIAELVYRSCLALDGRDFEGFLGLCHRDFRYAIRAYSPEIRREMTWLDLDRGALETLFRNLPKHNSDHAPLSRHATVYTVVVDGPAKRAVVVTALQVFRTAPDGGLTDLFAVGKLHDDIALDDGGASLLRRTVMLDTRLLGIGSHVPF